MSTIPALPYDYDLEEGELIEEAFFSGNNDRPQNAPISTHTTASSVQAPPNKGVTVFKRKIPSTATVKRKRVSYFTSDEEDEGEDEPGPSVKRNRSANYVRSEDDHVSDSVPIDDDTIGNAPTSTAPTNSATSKKAPMKKAPATKAPTNAPTNNVPLNNNPNSPFNNFIDLTNDSDADEEQKSPPSKRTRSKVFMPSNAKGHLEPSQISQYRSRTLETESAFQQSLKRPRDDTLDSDDHEDGNQRSKRARSADSEDEAHEATASDSDIEVEDVEVPTPASEHDGTTTSPNTNVSDLQEARITQKRKIQELLAEYAATIAAEDEEDATAPPPKKQKIRPGKQPRKAAPPPSKKKDEPFRLLDLPGDIRIIIYDYLFFGKGRKIRRPSIHVAGKKFNRPRLETAIMRTCRALYTETHDYLSKRAHITLPLTKRKNVGYRMQQPDLMALLAYKQVTLEAWIKKPLEYKPRDKFSGNPTLGDTKLGRAFQELIPWLRGFQVMKGPVEESLQAKKQIWVDLCPMYDMGTNDEEAYEKERRAFVSTWRHEVLKGHAPGVDIRRVSRMGKKVKEAKEDEEEGEQ